MRRLVQFWRRSGAMIRRDVDAELAFHIDARTEALVGTGVPPDEARARALREFGDLEDARRYLRRVDADIEHRQRRRDYVSELRQDLAYGLRTLRRAPTFTITAVLTIALGVGANTAIFSVVHGVVFKPLPFPAPEQLVRIWSANPGSDARRTPVSPPDLDDWRAQRTQFTDIGGYWFADGGSGVDLTGSGDPQRLSVAFVTAGFFPALGARAEVGRLPRDDEMVRGGDDRVVVLSHGFWRRQFGADSSLVTRTVTLNGQPYRVVGVLGPAMRLPSDRVEAFIPYSTIPDESIPYIRPVRVLDVVARMKEGVTLAQARLEMNTITQRLSEQYPANANWSEATVMPLADAITGDVRRGLVALLGAVGFVLLLSCVNVASLLLARSSVREREVALRLSLGATRGRIVRQMITESLLLAAIGGTVGVAGAVYGSRALVALAAGQLPRTSEITLDGTVLFFALGATLVTGVLFGLAPAVRAAGTDLQSSLREAGRGLVSGGSQRLRTGLVVTEVALAVVLIVGAGLMTRSFIQLLRVDLGFRPERLLAVNFTINTGRHEGSSYRMFYRQVIDRVRAVPGLTSVGAVKHAPFRGNGERQSFVPQGMTIGPGEQPPTAAFIHVSDGYFATIGARVLQGREYNDQDGALRAPTPGALPVFSGTPTVVVNRTLADRWFPGGSAVGKSLRIGGDFDVPIIGVIADIRQTSIEEPVQPTVYINNMMNSRVQVTLVARTQGEPLAMAGAVRDAIWSLDREQTITSIFTFDQLVSEAVARPRLLTVLLGLFGASGLLLGAVGLYGVLAYLVSSRQREIGVRIALGASRSSVLAIVVRRGLLMAGTGTLIGVLAAFSLTRYLRDVLFGVEPNDLFTFAVVAASMIAVAGLASAVPARRAASVDPVIAFRSD
ncbi:MAG TPA: ABC transporter permease [Gemmatimonadaceae bacterium]